MIRNYKKAQILQMIYVFGVVMGLIILLFAFSFFSTNVECSALKADCGDNQYCGADFVCHDFPELKKTSVQEQTITTYSYSAGLIIVIIALIISLFIIRRKSK